MALQGEEASGVDWCVVQLGKKGSLWMLGSWVWEALVDLKKNINGDYFTVT